MVCVTNAIFACSFQLAGREKVGEVGSRLKQFLAPRQADSRLRLPQLTQHPLSFFDCDHESHWLDGGGTEAVLFIEGLGCIRDCVHENSAYSNGFGSSNCAQNSIAKQVCSEPLALPTAIDSEPAE